MRRRFLRSITVLLSVLLSLTAFVGCNLVTKNSTRDMDQIVATVNVTEKEHIYKKNLVTVYMNYGYIYTNYYGYSVSQAYEAILDELVDNRIIVQNAYKDFEENGGVKDGSKPVYSPERYLEEDEILDATYSVYKSVNDLLDAYTDDGTGEKLKDTVSGVRTVPTDAQNKTKELTPDEKQKYIDKGFSTEKSYERAAFNKVKALLEANELLGKDYDGTLPSTEYFKYLLKTNLENKIIEKYENALLETVRKSIDFEALNTAYSKHKQGQAEMTNEEFVSALSSATADSPMLYHSAGTYGYVYNLLIGINDYQQSALDDLKEDVTHDSLSDAEYSARRAEILKATLAKDLRSSWILSGYDLNYDEEKETVVFTGDYTFAKNSGNSLAFQGKVKEHVAKTDTEDGEYSVTEVTSFELDGFIDFILGYVYPNETLTESTSNGDVYASDIYAAYKRAGKPEEYDAKINELLFAFSTDSGSLNTYKGYVIKPAVDKSNNEEYVKTFAEAGRALLSEGGSGFKVVASDYGYHFMFCSEVLSADYGFNSLEDYLISLGVEKDEETSWQKYLENQIDDFETFSESKTYLYALYSELVSAKISNKATKTKNNIITNYRYQVDGAVEYFKNAISDLIG